MPFHALRFLLILLPIVLGLGSTLFWLYGDDSQSVPETPWLSLTTLAMVCALTLGNIMARWFRWHFLTRRLGARLLTRESFRFYFASLPLVLTPYYIGEILRTLVLSKREPRLRQVALPVWLVERMGDAAGLGFWTILGLHGAFGTAAFSLFLLVVTAAIFGRLEQTHLGDRHPGGAGILALTFLLVSISAWFLPILAFWAVLQSFSINIGWMAVSNAFGTATFAGAMSPFPGGVGVTGSLAIVWLQQISDAAMIPWCVAIIRFGTIWFTVTLGLFALWNWRKSVIATYQDKNVHNHFDEIAEMYSDEIPDHVKDRLLSRKINLMVKDLSSRGQSDSLSGLDIGCGQGWYASEMAMHGFCMAGVDMSEGQIQHANQYAEKQGLSINFQVSSAAELPFPDNSFDFAYSINVFHHITDEAARQKAFRELVRVLKPGGVFFLHEMNTINPLFRFYMSYLFPLLNSIDEGNERWILPNNLPPISGANWAKNCEYFTFLPDFISKPMLKCLSPLERTLENSPRHRPYSAHYLAYLFKN